MSGAPPRPKAWDEQAHADFSGLQERTTGLEKGLGEVKTDMAELKRATAAGFSALSSKLDEQSAARNTNIGSFLATSASVAGVVLLILGGFFWAVVGPMAAAQRDIVADLKFLAHDSVSLDTFKSDKAGQDGWIGNIRDRLRADEDAAVTQRQVAELKERLDERYKITEQGNHDEIARLLSRVDALDSQLIKRPEVEGMIAALNERITTVAGGLHELSHDVGSTFTIGDRLKGMEAELAEVRRAAILPEGKGVR